MPLILMVGFPSSGKSTVVDALMARLHETRPDSSIVVVRDQDLTTFDKEMYRDSNKEKEHRGYLRSLVQKSLTDQAVVIVDSLNYIKGFRYELYCSAKLMKTTYCVIHCDATPETIRRFNAAKPEQSTRYADDVLEALVQRFESPDGRSRWDSPLFVVNPTVDEERPRELTAILDRVIECVFDGGNRLKANLSTQSQPISSTNFLFELDSLTQSIVQSLMDAQKNAMAGDQLPVLGTDQRVIMKSTRTLGELTRMRRQFMAYTKAHPIDDKTKLATMFVSFINES